MADPHQRPAARPQGAVRHDPRRDHARDRRSHREPVVHHGPERQGARGGDRGVLRARSTPIGCASGTDALLLALMAIGVGPGDEVICPSYTFFATGGSIHRLGAKPVFADIDPVTYNIDPDVGPRPPPSVHAASRRSCPCTSSARRSTWTRILALGARARRARHRGRGAGDRHARTRTAHRAGSRGAIGCFSFFPSKNLGALRRRRHLHDERRRRSPSSIAHPAPARRQAEVLPPGRRHQLASRRAAGRGAAREAASTSTPGRRGASATRRGTTDVRRRPARRRARSPLDGGGFPLRTPAPAARPPRHIYNQYVIRVPAAIRDALREELTAKNDRHRDLLPGAAAPPGVLRRPRLQGGRPPAVRSGRRTRRSRCRSTPS